MKSNRREEIMTDIGMPRRAVLAATAGLALSGGIAPGRAADASSTGGPLSPLPIDLPKTEFVYEAVINLEPRVNLGASPLGDRFMIAFNSGVFEGPKIKGTVLPGADRQLLRKDGALMLNALYELKADDGAIITVNNRVLITKRPDGSPYAFSSLDVIAPEGPHAWLNHLVLVGTLHVNPPEPKVLIRVFSLT
jgi:Protein of unknown function (DUF3237)